VSANRKRSAHVRRIVAIGLLFSLLAPTACSKKSFDDLPTGVAPAQAAQSPPVTQAPPGTVRPVDGGVQSALFDGRTGELAVLTAGPSPDAPSSLTVMGPQQTSERVVPLPGPATGMAGDNTGFAYLSTRGGYFVVDLAVGHATQVSVRDANHVDFRAITRRSDGTLVLGTADGTLYALAPGATEASRTAVHAHVDSLAAQGNTVAVLDRGQTSIVTVGVDGRIGQSLRAGQGATTMVADPAGRLLVADTRGGQLLVFGVDPLILRQAYPVADSPYGVVGSHGLVWVSQTSANTVIGYDLSTGIPLEKVRYPSVRQPNALAFDDAAGTLYVVSGAGAGVQSIEHAATGTR
jgi:outer membrane protein assembly factor BamB